jgi:hypothetical protein
MLRVSFDARPARVSHSRSTALATPNYSYEKRQRELAKKRKNEEKLQKKKQGPGDDGVEPGREPGAAEPAENRTTPPAAD